MATLQSLDIRRRSASTETPPQVRQAPIEVAKLIDVSKCIGCKACQAACLEWNDLKQEIGYTDGIYNNPTDLTPASWTVRVRHSSRGRRRRFMDPNILAAMPD